MSEHQHTGYTPINLSFEEILVAQVYLEDFEQPTLLPEVTSREEYVQDELFKSAGPLFRSVVSLHHTTETEETEFSASATNSFPQPQLDLYPRERLF